MKNVKTIGICIILAALLTITGCAPENKENNNRENETMSEEVTKVPEQATASARSAFAIFPVISSLISRFSAALSNTRSDSATHSESIE